MSDVRLKINGEQDFTTNHPLITFGRTSDNSVPLDDTNVSRYHARLEQRADGWWIIDQESSNGTTVNGNPVETEMLLKNGDVIVFGGTSEVVFHFGETEEDEPQNPGGENLPEPEKAGEEETKKSSALMMVAGAVVGLAVITAAVAGVVIWSGWEKKCEAAVRIRGAESGDVVNQTTEITADVRQKTPCVGEVVFLLDGREFGRDNSEPYKANLEAPSFADLSDGLNHRLKIVLLDNKGEVIPQVGDEIALVFETLETPTPQPETTKTPVGTTPTQKPQNRQIGTIETQEMVRRFLRQNFPKAPNYKIDQQFLIEVNKKTAEYVTEGYYARAMQYRDIINVAYAQEQNLDVPLGYILAVSRSKMLPQKQGFNEGLWQMSNDFVTANAFNGMCGTETLSDASQACAAKSSALYLKAIFLNVFEGDLLYSVAAFGMSPQQAAEWRMSLPPNRDDFMNVIKSPKQREEVIRFFAAGIVADNPGRFGLKQDRPISEVYRNLVGN